MVSPCTTDGIFYIPPINTDLLIIIIIIMDPTVFRLHMAIMRVHWVHSINTKQCRATGDLCTKSTDYNAVTLSFIHYHIIVNGSEATNLTIVRQSHYRTRMIRIDPRLYYFWKRRPRAENLSTDRPILHGRINGNRSRDSWQAETTLVRWCEGLGWFIDSRMHHIG